MSAGAPSGSRSWTGLGGGARVPGLNGSHCDYVDKLFLVCAGDAVDAKRRGTKTITTGRVG
jgi:hypothetical protein